MGVNSTNHNYRRLITRGVPLILLEADHWFDAQTENYLRDKITTNVASFVAGNETTFNQYNFYRNIPSGLGPDPMGPIYIQTETGGSPSLLGLPARNDAGTIVLFTNLNNSSKKNEGVTIFCVRGITPTSTQYQRNEAIYSYNRNIDNALDGAIQNVIVYDAPLNQTQLQVLYKRTISNTPFIFTSSLSFDAGDPSPQIEVVAVKPNLQGPDPEPTVYRTRNGQGVKPSDYGTIVNPDPTLTGSDSTVPYRISNAFPVDGTKRVFRRYGELIVFKRALSISQINAIENYLKSKWNISY